MRSPELVGSTSQPNNPTEYRENAYNFTRERQISFGQMAKKATAMDQMIENMAAEQPVKNLISDRSVESPINEPIEATDRPATAPANKQTITSADDFTIKMATEPAEDTTINPAEPPADKPAENPPETTATLQKRAESFLKRHGQLLNFFSKDSSLKFVPSATADTFSFNPKNFNLNVPLSWFANEAYTEGELEFVNYHERAHFIDMRKNPEAYLDNFKQMKKDAEGLAGEYCKAHTDQSVEAVKGFYYQELHTLYNCLDDIYVNRLVTERVPRFDDGDGRREVTTLYQKNGFAEADLTELPLHQQMAFALLRDAMVENDCGVSEVDARVRSTLDKKVMGKSMRTLVDFDLSPKRGVLTDPAERYKLIRVLIQPEYLKLLDIALQEQEKQNQKNEQDGKKGEQGDTEGSDTQNAENADAETNGNSTGSDQDGNTEAADNSTNTGQANDDPQPGGGQSGSKFDPFRKQSQNGPKEFIDTSDDKDRVIRQILDKFIEDDKVKEMSPEERARYQARKRQEEFDKEHGISESERKENERIKVKISRARRKMRTFWKHLIGKSVEYRTARQHQQRKGRLNVRDYIRKYPDVQEAERKGDLRSLEVYDRNGLERMVVDQPEKIDVTLLVDCSGSMSSDRVRAAQETAALLMYSLKDFNDEIESTRAQTRTKLRADTQVIAFGSNFEEVKPFETNRAKADADIIKSISAIDNDRGGTDDAMPLAWIKHNLTEQEKMAMRDKKLKKIIFEITDGQPNSPSQTNTNIRSLAKDGVIMVGFQIGEVDESEKETFEEVWGRSGNTAEENVKGIHVGSDVNTLPDRLMKELSEALGNIII